jgi:tol-pal system protein YbgF
VRRVLLVCSFGLAAGCAGPRAAAPGAEEAGPPAADVSSLRKENQALQGRLRELEARIALADAELSDLRARSGHGGLEGETVRIGSDAGRRPQDGPTMVWEEPASEVGPRPVLRLHGRSEGSGSAELLPVPGVPPGLPDRLPVAPLPSGEGPHHEVQAWSAGSAPAPSSESDPATRAYREALASVRDQRFAEAEGALQAFLTQHPGHALTPDALYWLGEVLYALRHYDRALAAFGRVTRDFSRSTRVPEAMFKMGLCEKRLGRPQRARSLFDQVRQSFPGTVSARMAAQEDAS